MSTGIAQAFESRGQKFRSTVVDLNQLALESHAKNHPRAEHICANVGELDLENLFRGRNVHHLHMSPECTSHSKARGKAAIKDSSRDTAWQGLQWVATLRPEVVTVENVPEFANWGPVDENGVLIPERKGETFNRWIRTFESYDYIVTVQKLFAADFGDPTIRERLIVIGRRGLRRPACVLATHDKEGTPLKARWRGANTFLDLSLKGESIFTRKHPLCPNTMERIWRGLAKYGLTPSKAYVVGMRGTSPEALNTSTKPVEFPVGAISTRGCSHNLLQVFLTHTCHSAKRPPIPLNKPIGSVACRLDYAVCEPFLLPQQAGGAALKPCSQPVGTLTTAGAERLLLPEVKHDGKIYSMDATLRMLNTSELQQAQGFPVDYVFLGTKTEQCKQIGNAVPVNLARAVTLAAIS